MALKNNPPAPSLAKKVAGWLPAVFVAAAATVGPTVYFERRAEAAKPRPLNIPFSNYIAKVHLNEIRSVGGVDGRMLCGLTRADDAFCTKLPEGDTVDQAIVATNAAADKVSFIDIRPAYTTPGKFQPAMAWNIFGLPLAIGALSWGLRRLQDRLTGKEDGAPKKKKKPAPASAGRFGTAGGSGTSAPMAETPKVRFKDIAGIDDALEEVREIVEFLKDPERFEKLGAEIPRGVLLKGPPGTGKTLMARATAGEADVPIFKVSGSQFMQELVGVGAKRVRELFAAARAVAPCIVFIDELDAIGGKRGKYSSHEEREQTLNQLLVEMGDEDAAAGVIVFGATNRWDMLDEALLRPGRFDRKIDVGLPDEKGREQILAVHMKDKPTEGPIDLPALARIAYDFSGAKLRHAANEAAIAAALDGRNGIRQADLRKAIEDEALGGREKKSKILSEAQQTRVDIHEAGHAVMTHYSGTREIVKATDVPRENSLGMVWSRAVTDDIDTAFLEKDLGIALGGRIAEEIFYKGPVSPGAAQDINQVTDSVRSMVLEWGIGEGITPLNYKLGEERGLDALSRSSDATKAKIDAAIDNMVGKAFESTRKFLSDHWSEVVNVAKALHDHRTLDGAEVAAAIRGEPIARQATLQPA